MSIGFGGIAQAADVTFGGATHIGGDADVSTSGVFVSAFFLAGSTNTTVNGVTFAAVGISGDAVASYSAGSGEGSISGALAGSHRGGGAFDPNSGNLAALSAAYHTLLGSTMYANSTSTASTVTFNNLVVGTKYQVQLWANFSSGQTAVSSTLSSTGGGSVILDNNVSNSTGGLGQYTVATFVADAATQTINVAPINGYCGINAVQLRDISLVTGPPEIISATQATGVVGEPLSYTIVAANPALSFSATGLPAGLGFTASTGVISGTPTVAGVSIVTLGTANAYGTDQAELTLTVAPEGSTKPFVHPLFTNGMVLQRDRPAPVWGWTIPDKAVAVTLNGQTNSATADRDGYWRVAMGPFPAGGPYTLTVSGPQEATVTNVMMGDVYLCSGQSNMERRLGTSPGQPDILNYQAEAAAANYPLIRQFKIPKNAATRPLETVNSGWVVCAPGTVLNFSAVGYFFARDLHLANSVAIGVLHAAYGGTEIKPWLEADAAAEVADLTPYVYTLGTKTSATYADVNALYNAMIAPLTPFAMKGVLWYQGESNADRPEQYGKLLPALMSGWRSAFEQPSLPFVVVQLPNYSQASGQWPELRESQLHSTMADANSRLTVNIELGSTDIHPPDKQDVGQRAAWAALNLDGKPYALSPLFSGATVEGSSIRCHFTNVADGLMAGTKEPLTPATQDPAGVLTGFLIAGADKTFMTATATIDPADNTVVVSNPLVPTPVYVRYAWDRDPNPKGNLYNKITAGSGTVIDGLPASPFRTDAVNRLNVTGGTGSGLFNPGDVKTIAASAAPSGQSFSLWRGDVDLVGNANGAATTATLSRAYVSVGAHYHLNTAPAGLSATSASDTTVALQWTAISSNVWRYTVKRSTAAGGPYTTLSSDVATTQYTDASVDFGKTYYYVVTARNGAGESPNSTQLTVATAAAPAPLGFLATAGNGLACLNWNPTAGMRYTVSRGTASGGPYTPVVVDIAAESFVDQGLGNGSTYYYVVAVSNGASRGAASAEVSVTPSDSAVLIERSVSGFSSDSANPSNSAESADKAFDGDPATKWFTSFVAMPQWLRYQFPGSFAWAVSRYRITSAGDTPARDPMDWQLQGSNDGSNWTMLDTRAGETFSSRNQTKTYDFPNSTVHRYHRLYVTAVPGGASTGLQIAELALFSGSSDAGDATAPAITTPGNLVVAATGTSGAVVNFTVTALDVVSGSLTPTINPASGSLFPVGTTTVQCAVTDLAGNNATASFTVRVHVTFDTYLAQYFTPAQLNDPAVSGATADPDGDGKSNLLEYATGTHPSATDAAPSATPGTTAADAQLTLTFNRIADPSLSYELLASDDLASWQVIWTSTGEQNVAGPVTVIDGELIADHPKRFLKLRISQQL